MKHISVLIKPASSICNMSCKYCFYNDVSSLRDVKTYGKMNQETTEIMIEQIYKDLEDGDELTLAFQGGEPTLAGLEYFRHMISWVTKQDKNVTVHYAIQTNGTVINEEWCQFLKEHNFLVGLSIDGPASFHDMNRIDHKHEGTFQKVMQTKKIFEDFHIEYNVLCVLTNQLAKEPEEMFHFIKENGIQYVQFIPCLGELEKKEKNDYALTPQGFAYFYKRLFYMWLEELKQGHYISIKLFDDLFHLFVNRHLTACGIIGNCQVQFVIEADGSVYPCDFYVLDEYRLGYIQEKGLKELFEQGISKEFLCSKTKLPLHCERCNFLKVCNGGCKRMKDVIYVSEENNYCGYQEVLNTYIPKINNILQYNKGAV